MTGELSRGLVRWKCTTGEDAGYLQLDEKTPEASLQLGIDCIFLMRSVESRIWSRDFGCDGSADETLFFKNMHSNLFGKNEREQYLVGSFGGALSF